MAASSLELSCFKCMHQHASNKVHHLFIHAMTELLEIMQLISFAVASCKIFQTTCPPFCTACDCKSACNTQLPTSVVVQLCRCGLPLFRSKCQCSLTVWEVSLNPRPFSRSVMTCGLTNRLVLLHTSKTHSSPDQL